MKRDIEKLRKFLHSELRDYFEERKFEKIDISNFKYEDNEDILMLLCYLNYMESSSVCLPNTIDRMKKYILSMRKWCDECKRSKTYVFAIAK